MLCRPIGRYDVLLRLLLVASMSVAVSLAVAGFVTAAAVFSAATAYKAVMCEAASLAFAVLAVVLLRDLMDSAVGLNASCMRYGR